MADGFTPLGNQIQAQPGMSLADVMNIARGAQAYNQAQQINPLMVQQQQAITGAAQIDYDKLTQANKERLALQDFFATPDNWQTPDGQLDLSKVSQTVPKIAPLTGPDYIQKLSATQKSMTDAQTAMQNLDQSDRSMVSTRLGIIGRLGVQDRDSYLNELDLLSKENPNNNNLSKVVTAYKNIFNNMPAQSPALPQAAIRASQSMLEPSKQEEMFAPKLGTVNTGAALYPTTTTTMPGGAAPQMTVGQTPLATQQLGPGSRYQSTGRTDALNRPTVYAYSPDGTLLGEMVAPEYQGQGQPQTPGGPVAKPGVTPAPMTGGGLAPTRIPPNETPETGAALATSRANANTAARNVPAVNDSINQVVDLVDKLNSGRFGQAEASLASRFGYLAGKDNATNIQQMGHYLGILSQSLSQQMGLRQTDAAAVQADNLAGKTDWTADAIKQTSNTLKAYNTGISLFNQGQERFLANNQSMGIYAKRQWDNAWANNFNVDSMRLYNAAATQNPLEIDKAAREMGGVNSMRYKKAMSDAQNLRIMVKQGILPSNQ